MAKLLKPICPETPILYGEDARRFLKRMENPPKETKEQYEERMKLFNALMETFEGPRF